MAQLVWRNLIGQDRIKQMLSSALANGTLGHAYLFCGQEGTGKFQAALELGMALMCPAQSVPCYECASCRKILNHAHPDFHYLFPTILGSEYRASDGRLNERGWEHLSKLSQERIAAPYARPGSEGKGVPVIPVDWVRSTNHAILRGPVEGTKCVVVLDGIDEMTTESANAMLKVLEEPPAGTHLLLLTSRPSAMLPTITSRCQILRFGALAPQLISAALGRAHPDISEAAGEAAVRFAMGSLGRALAIAEEPCTESEEYSLRMWSMCANGDWEGVVACIDEVSSRTDHSFYEQFYVHGLHVIRDGLIGKIAAPEKYISIRDNPPPWANIIDLTGAQQLARRCEDAIAALKAHGNPRLILVNFVLSIAEILNGKEQQAC